jgi:hypothetical protein
LIAETVHLSSCTKYHTFRKFILFFAILCGFTPLNNRPVGTFDGAKIDYPDVAKSVAQHVLDGSAGMDMYIYIRICVYVAMDRSVK